nr:olfactory receptor [Microplitis mediator]
MNFFEQPYYKLPRNFARSIGRWPYQSELQRFIIAIAIIFAFILQVGPKILADIVHSDDQELIFETLAPTITDVASFAKYMNTFINAKMIKRLLQRIKDDWTFMPDDSEKLILKKYAGLGKLMATGYVGFVYMTTVMFITEPLLPMIINLILKTNISAPHEFPVPMEWIVIDKEKYYWLLFSNSSVCIMVILTVLISYDVIFITFMHHAYGLFAITGYQSFPNLLELNPSISWFKLNVFSVDIESKICLVMQYVKTILHPEQMYHQIQMMSIINIWFRASELPLMSITGIQIIAKTSTFQQKIKYVMFTGAQMLHLFFECFLSQQLTDMSLRIQQHIANGKWYNISSKSQKLLILMTMRCQVPCTLTAGKIMGLSIESFGMMMKTSGSYFTVLLSMQ